MVQSLQICQGIGNWLEVIDRLGLYCLVLNEMGEFEKSRLNSQEGLRLAQEHNRIAASPLLLAMCGGAEAGLGDPESAKHYLRLALRESLKLQKMATIAIVMISCARLLVQEGNELATGNPRRAVLQQEACALANAVYTSAEAWQIYRDKAAVMLRDLDVTGPGEPCSASELMTVAETVFPFLS
jgi:hypothetical protein